MTPPAQRIGDPAASSPPPPARVDGRTARSERTRTAIVDAHLRLISEGDLRPTAERIAKQAGVSLRALWSHFADMEALFAASGRQVLERRTAAYRPVSPALPLGRRIEAFCEQQARLLEQIAPVAKASAVKEPFSETLQHYRRLHVERTRTELVTLFAVELNDDDELLNALVAVSMWPTWSTWREVMTMSAPAARRALARIIGALLAG